MKSSKPAQVLRGSQVAWLTVTVGLAMLFLVVLLYGSHEVIPIHADPDILFVDGTSGSNTRDCTDPANPCVTIGRALNQAEDGDTILVAKGVYTENLVITKTVILEGGYEPVGWVRRLRDCETTVDGNQSSRVPVLDIRSTLSETTVIDGFTITHGDGGVSILLSSVIIQNGRIVDNHTTGNRSGGGMLIDRSYVTITNILIADNESAYNDGAMRIVSTGGQPQSRVRIHNTTVANNDAQNGRNGIFCSNSDCRIVNSIVWGHGGEDLYNVPGVTFSDIEMGHTGEGNISRDPRFIDPANANYHLQPDSPCIDSGTNVGAPDIDFEGDSRPIDGNGDGFAVVDMGADEVRYYQVFLPLTLKSFGP